MKSFNIGDLKIPVPIIQGGMGIGISMSGLASAVANMGGIGVIATVGIGLTQKFDRPGYKINNIEALKKEIRKARELSKGIIGVNIMSVLTDFKEMVETSIKEGIDVIFSGAGLPLDLPKYLTNNSKTKLVPIVSSGRAATIICKKWHANYNYLPDAFVVEGPKAGGHLGFKADDLDKSENILSKLVADVKHVVDIIKNTYNKNIPVIAAGGIYNGQDILDIMNSGAEAVQLGTRFVATEECDASDEFKNAYVNALEEDITIIKSPVGMPGRSLKSQFIIDAAEGKKKPVVCKHNCIKSCDPKTTSYCISEALVAGYKGNLKDGFVFTGANAGKVHKIVKVKDVFDELKMEYTAAESKLMKKGVLNTT